MGSVREPIKKSSIEKKQRIIKLGFELMCEKGYHNVNTVDIAKYADVSTGIIYQYFSDKRNIFIEGTKDYANAILFPMLDVIDKKIIDKSNIGEVISKMIDNFIKTHTMKKEAHEELMAMSYLDKDVSDIFTKNELDLTKKIADYLVQNGFDEENIEEKVHIIIGIVDNYCHEVVYHKHKTLDYGVMKKQIIKIIKDLL
ncbi:TetR/AcrR family transcriptional regulator [bacterium]|nr:TetR/AcrR family transcriptional regulator [bacterium]